MVGTCQKHERRVLLRQGAEMSSFTSYGVHYALENGLELLGGLHRLSRLLLLERSRPSHPLARHWLLELIHISK